MTIYDLNDDVLEIIIDKISDNPIIQALNCNNLARTSKRFNKLIQEKQYKNILFEKLLKCQTSNDLLNFYYNYANGNLFCCQMTSNFETFLYVMCLELLNDLSFDNDKSYFIALVMSCVSLENISCREYIKIKNLSKIDLRHMRISEAQLQCTIYNRCTSSFIKRIYEHKKCLHHCDYNNYIQKCIFVCRYNHYIYEDCDDDCEKRYDCNYCADNGCCRCD